LFHCTKFLSYFKVVRVEDYVLAAGNSAEANMSHRYDKKIDGTDYTLGNELYERDICFVWIAQVQSAPVYDASTDTKINYAPITLDFICDMQVDYTYSGDATINNNLVNGLTAISGNPTIMEEQLDASATVTAP